MPWLRTRPRCFPLHASSTPNLDEAALLLGHEPDAGNLEAGARALHARYGCPVLLKGGHAEGDPVDLLCTAETTHAFRNVRIHGVNTHGSGCTLSAAIAAYLAHGMTLEVACGSAIRFLHDALTRPATLDDRSTLIGIEHAAPGLR